VRLAIVREFAALGARAAGVPHVHVGVSNSTLSHHFKVLREARVIEMRPNGHLRLNRLHRAELDERFPGLLDSVLRLAVPA